MPIWSSAIAPAAPMRRLRKRSGSSRSQGTTTSTTRVTSVSAWSTAVGSWWAYHAVHGRQRLGLEVEVERRRGAPGGIAAQELGRAREEHELEQQEHQQHAGERRRAPLPAAQAPGGRRPQHRQQPRLQQQRVPLKGEEVLSRHGEREVQRPEQEEHRHRGHAEHEKDGQHGAAPGHGAERSIARAKPEDRRQLAPRSGAVARADPVEEPAGRHDAPLTDETDDLSGQRDERQKPHDAKEPEKEAPGQDVGRSREGPRGGRGPNSPVPPHLP